MRKNVVYSIVLLTVFCLSLVLVPGGFSQTENVKILNYTYYFDLQGYLVVVGEVQNVGQTILNNVVLHGTVTSSDGTPTESAVGAWVTNLVPGQKAPFYMVFYSSSNMDGTWSSDVASVNLYVVQADATTSYQYSDVTIKTQTSSIGNTADDKGVYWVRGTLQNVGGQTAKNVSVVATFYNSSGDVVGAGHTYTETVVPSNISPSGTATFEIAAYDLNMSLVPSRLKIDHYSLLVQVIEPLITGTAPVITATATPGPGATLAPTDATSATNTQSATSNPTDSTSNPVSSAPATWIYPAVIVVVLAAIIGVALVLRKRKPQEASKNKK